MGFLKSLLTGRRPGSPRGGMIPEGEVHTPWQGPGQRTPHEDPQAGSTKRAHRGLALKDRERPDISPENAEHWTALPDSWAREFVYYNQELHVYSSNIQFAQYWIKSGELFVQFLSGHSGTYSGVTEAEAVDFTQAGSKGGWVIDVCIGRENLQGHKCWHGGPSRKPYKADYRPSDIAMIPQAEIAIVGEPIALAPVEIVGGRTVAQEDIAKDNQRRQHQPHTPAAPWVDSEAQRRATAEFKRRLLGG